MLRSPQEAQLYVTRDMSGVDAFAVAAGTAVVHSARSPAKESPNEDAAALLPIDTRRAVLAVADGLGGSPSGARAAEIAMEALGASLAKAAGDGAPLRGAILDAIERAQEEVAALGVGAGTTLAIAEIESGSVRPYHVGDSPILLAGQRGRVKLQTVSHSPVGFGVEAGLLDEREALHHEERHIVSNVIGAADMRVEVGATRRLAPRDTLLLASDGLFDNLHVEEIVEHIRAGALEEAVQGLVAEARRRMTRPRTREPSKPDDLTLIAFRLTA